MSTLIVNPEITDAVHQTNNAVLGVARTEANGIAHQLVAQAAAMAIQDASEYLRNLNAISTAATGVAMEMLLSNPDKLPQAKAALEQIRELMQAAASNFATIGEAANAVINTFPST